MRYLEYKHTYSGETKVFECELASRSESELVLTFSPKEPMRLIGIDFPVGSTSFGYFWKERNYNLYHWKDSTGRTLLYYFNICRDTKIAKERVDWVDLIVDVVCTPGSPPKLLDLDEVPENMPIEDVAVIGETTKLLFSSMASLTSEMEKRTAEISMKIGALNH
ncbi:MAG: DUF402 domain-containing protein [Thaumarchaeota archaeon]|nr:DUF402 domain-containing protein [Nitrososphaerota archaeon]